MIFRPVCAVLAFAALVLLAQQDSFHVQTKVVQVPVTVTARSGRNVDGLRAHDFKVLDDGLPQDITVDDFSSGLAPINLIIAVQNSGISAAVVAKVRKVGSMIQPLITGQRGSAALVVFNSQVQWLQELTSEDDKLQKAFRDLKPSEMDQARMLDAMVDIASHTEQAKGRKIILLISENRDRGSKAGFQQALDAIEGQGIEVFCAHYSAAATALGNKSADLPNRTPELQSDDPTKGPPEGPGVNLLAILLEAARTAKTDATRALARASGGVDYPFLKQRGLETAISNMGAEVHSQYVLNFAQHSETPGMHRIEVSVPNRDDLKIRARLAYWVDKPVTAQ